MSVCLNNHKQLSYSEIQYKIRTINQNLHNCSFMLDYKKKLQKEVHQSNHVKLKKHFKTTKYQKRKRWFYQKIVEDILKFTRTIKEKNIIRLTTKILQLYHEKQNMKNHLKNQLYLIDQEDKDRDAYADEEERMRECFIEDNRYVD